MADTVLITGASAGIGRELAWLYAASGSELILVARRVDRLRELADEIHSRHDVAVAIEAVDLARAEAPRRLFESLSGRGVAVDVLVNNAGFGAVGRFAALDADRQIEMLRLNVEALTELTRLCLPGMLARGRGGILNVGSTAAFQPGPMMAVYYATKAYVQSFTEALAEELRGTGVRVTCLAPGPTATEFGAVSGMGESTLFALGTMDARAVARAGFDGLARGRVIVIPGAMNRVGVTAIRFAPRAWVRRIVHRLQATRVR